MSEIKQIARKLAEDIAKNLPHEDVLKLERSIAKQLEQESGSKLEQESSPKQESESRIDQEKEIISIKLDLLERDMKNLRLEILNLEQESGSDNEQEIEKLDQQIKNVQLEYCLTLQKAGHNRLAKIILVSEQRIANKRAEIDWADFLNTRIGITRCKETLTDRGFTIEKIAKMMAMKELNTLERRSKCYEDEIRGLLKAEESLERMKERAKKELEEDGLTE